MLRKSVFDVVAVAVAVAVPRRVPAPSCADTVADESAARDVIATDKNFMIDMVCVVRGEG